MKKKILIPNLFVITIIILGALCTTGAAVYNYIGPDRTVTESHVETYDWGVWAKPDPTGNSCNHTYGTDCVVCTWEHTPGAACGDATYSYRLGRNQKW